MKGMTHGQIKSIVASMFDGDPKVAHGKFMIENRDNRSVIVGVSAGDLLAKTDRREVVNATIIVLVHKTVGTTEASPEDFLEGADGYLKSPSETP